jgi:DnaK suppressor protein
MTCSQIDQVTSIAQLTASRRKLTMVLAGLASSYCDVSLAQDFVLPDSSDQLALDGDRNLMLNRLEWMSLLTRQVSEALGRIDNGTYGLCLRCRRSIGVKRLAALPWVAFCTTCQEGQAPIRIV